MIENQSSAFTITIIPAASFSLSSLERLVKSMRTGMRCCILTKFPAELSVGTNEYLEPVAPDMAVIVPVNSLSLIASTVMVILPMIRIEYPSVVVVRRK